MIVFKAFFQVLLFYNLFSNCASHSINNKITNFLENIISKNEEIYRYKRQKQGLEVKEDEIDGKIKLPSKKNDSDLANISEEIKEKDDVYSSKQNSTSIKDSESSKNSTSSTSSKKTKKSKKTQKKPKKSKKLKKNKKSNTVIHDTPKIDYTSYQGTMDYLQGSRNRISDMGSSNIKDSNRISSKKRVSKNKQGFSSYSSNRETRIKKNKMGTSGNGTSDINWSNILGRVGGGFMKGWNKKRMTRGYSGYMGGYMGTYGGGYMGGLGGTMGMMNPVGINKMGGNGNMDFDDDDIPDDIPRRNDPKKDNNKKDEIKDKGSMETNGHQNNMNGKNERNLESNSKWTVARQKLGKIKGTGTMDKPETIPKGSGGFDTNKKNSGMTSGTIRRNQQSSRKWSRLRKGSVSRNSFKQGSLSNGNSGSITHPMDKNMALRKSQKAQKQSNRWKLSWRRGSSSSMNSQTRQITQKRPSRWTMWKRNSKSNTIGRTRPVAPKRSQNKNGRLSFLIRLKLWNKNRKSMYNNRNAFTNSPKNKRRFWTFFRRDKRRQSSMNQRTNSNKRGFLSYFRRSRTPTIYIKSVTVNSIRLNVPRILLPYHPEVQSIFLLSVSNPEGHCFKWRSTRNEIVSVEPIYDSPGCSTSAKIVSRSHYQAKQTAIVFAENSESNILLNCDVAVDTIDRIFITTNAKLLFIEASPSQVYVEAENKEGERFSSLSNIPFEWSINSVEGRPLRIIPYSRSKYDAPYCISELEQKKKKGYVILVEGLSTGTATLDVKFEDKHFSNVAPASITFNVVANLLLIPSNDIYMTINSQIEYMAGIVKQQGMEKINLPSEQYYLKLEDENVVKFKQGTSKIIAMKLGQCEVTLIDSFLKHEGESIKRESAHIYVVQPDSITFTNNRNNDNWYLQVGDVVEISVGLTDASGNHIYITNEMQFNTVFPNDYFKVISISKNHTSAVVKILQTGETFIHSSYESIMDAESRKIIELSPIIRGTQKVFVVDKVAIIPSEIVVPYLSTMRSIYQLKAIGGSGSYLWYSKNLNVGKVGLNDGILSIYDYGDSKIEVFDTQNKLNKAEASLKVLKPNFLEFGKSFLEAEVGSDIILNIELGHEVSGSERVLFTDCSSVPFTISVSDTKIFKIIDINKSVKKTGCRQIALKAMALGDTKISVYFNGLSASKDISSYYPVKPSKKQLLLALGSSHSLDFSEGPRPWIKDQSQFFTEITTNDENLSIKKSGNKFSVYCGNSVSSSIVTINVGNRKSESNTMPKVSSVTINVCCSIPKRLGINMNIKNNRDSKHFLPECPKQSLTIYMDSRNELITSAFGSCIDSIDDIERHFDSSNSMNVKWGSSNNKVLEIHPFKDNSILATAVSKSVPGQIDVTASISSFKDIFKNNEKILISHDVSTTVSLNVVNYVKAFPNKLVLWNEIEEKGVIDLVGGSGHFYFSNDKTSNLNVKLLSADFKVEVYPQHSGTTTITIYDVCILNSKVDVVVKVSDVAKLVIKSLPSVEIGSEIPVDIKFLSYDNEEFDNVNVSQMDIKVLENNNFGRLNLIGFNKYTVTGVKYGIYTLTATTKNRNNKIITSDPYNIQIFSPMEISPKVVTLLTESYFQFEFVGGPTPLPEVKFELSNNNIATVDSNGLILTKKNIGDTFVKIVSLNNQFKSSMEQVLIKVVTLKGIKIELSSNSPYVGEVISATIYGIGENESPFSFGGAIYPLSVEWKFSQNQNIEIIPIQSENPDDTLTNKFSIKFKVFNEGELNIFATVTRHQSSYKHFSTSVNQLKTSTRVEVYESVKLVPSIVSSDAIVISPRSTLKLRINKDNSHVKFSVPLHGDLITFLKADTIKALDKIGTAALKIEYTSPMETKIIYENIDIATPSTLYVDVESPFGNKLVNKELKIPQGTFVNLISKYLDSYGRVFSSHEGQVILRPNRFDFTQIEKTEDFTFNVKLIKAGETVIRVYDNKVPDLEDYVKVTAFDVVLPVLRKFTSNDIVCFNLPDEYIYGNQSPNIWRSDNDNVATFDSFSQRNGRFIMKNKGFTNIFVDILPRNISTFASIEVNDADSISFISSPSYISNFDSARYIINFVLTATDITKTTNTHSCSVSDLKSMNKIIPTFDCKIRFTKPQSSNVPISELFYTNSIFDTDSGFYACEIVHRNQSSNVNDVHFDKDQKIEVIVVDKFKKYKDNSITTFFMPKFKVLQTSLTFNNGPLSSNILSLYGPKEASKHIKIGYCKSVSFIISPLSTVEYSKYDSTPGNLFYEIEFNGLSANVDNADLKNCYITITNDETLQTVTIPVTIESEKYDLKIDRKMFFRKFFVLDDKTIFCICFTAFVACALLLFYKWIFGNTEYSPVYIDDTYRTSLSQRENSMRSDRNSIISQSDMNNETSESLGIPPLRTSTPSVMRKPHVYEPIHKIGRPSIISKFKDGSRFNL
uniref:Exported protein n=1 Tax=Strongyloides stercoralis TaxID=6248 RepID=A0A0K0E0Q5_STRER